MVLQIEFLEALAGSCNECVVSRAQERKNFAHPQFSLVDQKVAFRLYWLLMDPELRWKRGIQEPSSRQSAVAKIVDGRICAATALCGTMTLQGVILQLSLVLVVAAVFSRSVLALLREGWSKTG